jgi:DNA-binding transcriptional LysR family regulator
VLPQLSAGFNSLADGLAGLKASEEHVLALTVASVFATRWLIWRIGKFSALYPDIETRLIVTGRVLDLARSDIDCGIRFGRGDWPGVRAELIGGTTYQPVVAPPLAEKLKSPADLAHVPVIHDTTVMMSWDDWCRAAGLDETPRFHGPTYDDPALAYDAAISEQGVLLSVDMMSADAVSDGRLVRPFNLPVDTAPLGYWLAVPEGRREPRKTRLFREWLRAEVADSSEGYVAQLARRKATDR